MGEKEEEEEEEKEKEKEEEKEKVEDIQDKFKTNSKSKPHWNTGKLTNMASKEGNRACY